MFRIFPVMRRLFLLSILLLFLAAPLARASHIVGGEFELVHVGGFNYNLRLIQYFDVLNGNPGAEDSLVVAYIFRKADDTFVETITLEKVLRQRLAYTQPQCAIGNLQTNRLEYEKQFIMDPEVYNDPAGYYVVFERCCRNQIITNILAPDMTGQTFFLEFPPVVDEDGNPFINSTPRLFPPLSDYGCVDRPYYASFGGVDDDGDSLVYSFVSPRNSSAVSALPIPSPLPHPSVNWVPGIDESNMIPGNPGLQITPAGFMTVTPGEEGLFVFALVCEEYRNGIKIGRVQREFQMLVLDCGGGVEQPGISARKQDGSAERYSGTDTVFFSYDEGKCLDILVVDPNAEFGESERITLEYTAVNFNFPVVFDSTGTIDFPGDTLVLEACFPECPNPDGSPFIIEFRAADQTCPLPLKDTLNLVVVVEPPPNNDPVIVSPAVGPSVTLEEGDIFSLLIEGTDADGDSLDLSIRPIGFNLEDFGFVFVDSVDEAGRRISRLVWDTGCGVNDYGLFDEFRAWVRLDDKDGCDPTNADSVLIDLRVILPPNTDPEVSTTLGGTINAQGELEVDVNTFDDLNFDVTATDADGDFVHLALIGGNFDPEAFGIRFDSTAGFGSTGAPFAWSTTCEMVSPSGANSFLLYFRATDEDTCQIPNADTLAVRVNLIPPPNEAPFIALGEGGSDTVVVYAGNTLDLNILASDPDNDLMLLELIGVPDNLNADSYSFTSLSGNGNLRAPFQWNSLCDQLGPGGSPAYYTFRFQVQDNYCVEPQTDVVEVVFQLENQAADPNGFLPPNVFTPNGDALNETFYIENLPPDNCDASFKEVRIYNRWGKLVFDSDSRDFVWDGEGASTGVYYVYLVYTDREYKHYVHLMR